MVVMTNVVRPAVVTGVSPVLTRFVDAIPAGFPSPAEGYEDDALDLHKLIVRHPAATFFFDVDDDGYLDEHIRPGSVLVIDRSVVPAPGRLVMLEQDGAFVLRRMPPRAAGPVHVFGVLIAVVMRF